MPASDFINSLRNDAIAIWQAGVRAVDAEHLVRSCTHVDADRLTIAGNTIPLNDIDRCIVVGAGKAGAGMAAGFEVALGQSTLLDRLSGWVNVPADCVRNLQKIHLHAARPAGVNEPTEEGIYGTDEILKLVSGARSRDVCVVLLSGGGSALLPAPADGITLADKQHVTRLLMRAGASIDELNCVRKHLSRIKGGRLADSCRAGHLTTLIISDVIGDRLDVIASGPTVEDATTASDALAVLQIYEARLTGLPQAIIAHLQKEAGATRPTSPAGRHRNASVAVIGNIDVALNAAAGEARRLGYQVQSQGGANAGIARDVGADLAERCLAIRDSGKQSVCLLSGGEPTVALVSTDQERSGGRNQEVVLAAADRLWAEDPAGILILSGGTDGEDGPTDAAGAWIDASVLENARRAGIMPDEFLSLNNSYAFFARAGGHLKTGPTHTNVMDLRVCLIGGLRES